jgi:hypothetical protein
MSMDDLDGVATSATETDNGTSPEYSGAWDETVPEAKVSGRVIPPFQFLVVKPFTAKLRPSRMDKEGNENTPSGRLGVQVIEGIEGTVGERVFDDLYLGVSKTTYSDEVDASGKSVKRGKTSEELAKSITYFQHTLNRLAFGAGLNIKRPAGRSVAAFEQYLSQFDGEETTPFVVEVQIEAKQGQTPRNRIKWDTARSLTEPAIDAKLAREGKTALDEAKLRIAERNAAIAKAGGKATGTKAISTAPSLD